MFHRSVIGRYQLITSLSQSLPSLSQSFPVAAYEIIALAQTHYQLLGIIRHKIPEVMPLIAKFFEASKELYSINHAHLRSD